MKKLMIAAAAAAMTAGAFAAPAVYDFKATVKHTYLKPITLAKAVQTIEGVNLSRILPKGSKVYLKTTKSSTLKGYLVQDVDGSCTNGTITAKDAQPGNRCFLVVQNASAEKAVKANGGYEMDYRVPRIIPGIIDAKWYNNKLAVVKSLPAQGYLYLGGEVVANKDDSLIGSTFKETSSVQLLAYAPRKHNEWCRAANQLPSADDTKVSAFAIDDYFFSSCYLFGKYNQPSWNGTLPEEFADTWMNCAGFGKITFDPGWSSYCCGRGTGVNGSYILDTLTGSLKAGFFLCTENGEDDGHSKGLSRTGVLEDQLWLDVVANTYYTTADGTAEGTRVAVDTAFGNDEFMYDTNYHFFAKYQRTGCQRAVCDIWADGNLDLRTTDVGTGNWAIKFNAALSKSAAQNMYVFKANNIVAEAVLKDIGYPYQMVGTIKQVFDLENAKLNANFRVNFEGDPLKGDLIGADFVKAYFYADSED